MARTSEEFIYVQYTPPYDWEAVLAFFRAHQLPFVEDVNDQRYERVVVAERGLGWFWVENVLDRNAICLVTNGLTGSEKDRLTVQIRRMFDLDASPTVLGGVMERDHALSLIWKERPGLRLARAFSGFESIFTTVLGQLVSVSFGRKLVKELMRAAGTTVLHPKTLEPTVLFPSAKQILEADLSQVRTSDSRRQTIGALARSFEDSEIQLEEQSAQELREVLRSIPGIGAWTTEYTLLRGFGDNDAFPSTDYVLKQALKRYPRLNPKVFQPWRGYVAVSLWADFATSKAATASSSSLVRKRRPRSKAGPLRATKI